MKDILVRSLREDERKRFFEFAKNLPRRDLWGKKGYYLGGDFERFQGFFEYTRPFQPKCFLVAEEDKELVGFIAAVYNPEWIGELEERYGSDVVERAYILGIAVVERRRDVLKALVNGLDRYFHQSGIEGAEYPTLGGVCLTTGSDILTADNVDALLMFREAGFKISECYHSMSLDLETWNYDTELSRREETFRHKDRSIELIKRDEVLGRVAWDPVEDGTTDIDIYVKPAQRGKGFGTAPMARALQRLKAEGAKVVELGVDGNNLPALKLYREFGYEVDKTHFYIFVPFTSVVRSS